MNSKEILEAVKKEFDEEYMRFYVENNYADYLEEEDIEKFEESEYINIFDFYTQEGIGGNGFETDIMTEIGRWASEKFEISEDELWENEEFRYGIDYYIQEFFPYHYFVDYRKKSDLEILMDKFNDL